MGTTFAPGQMTQLQTNVNIAIATALPSVAKKFEPKTVLKALEGRGEIFAGHIEAALEQALNTMVKSAFALAPLGDVVVKIAEPRHDPDTFYRSRQGLYVWDGFRTLVVAKARPTDQADAAFTVNRAELTRDLTDEEIEAALPKEHLFSETDLCAIIAGLIAKQANGEEGALLNNGCANLFYTSSSVLRVRWRADSREWLVRTWRRDGLRWNAGLRVFSPAH